jgi:hypothetical protein
MECGDNAIVSVRREQQVHMVGHQDAGMQRTAAVEGGFAQDVEINEVIVCRGEAGKAVVSSLDDM